MYMAAGPVTDHNSTLRSKPEWYIAELVEKITVAEDSRNVVHQNLVLIRTTSADEAYEKAVTVGKNGETSYENPAGNLVHITFEGISDLVQMYEDLEDGAELTFRRTVGLTHEQIRALIVPRDQLPVYLPPRRAEGPDYASRAIVEEVERRFGIKRPEK
jgi:hypothetical protein